MLEGFNLLSRAQNNTESRHAVIFVVNRVGKFNMEHTGDGPQGPPPAVKAILSKFSSGKEEDKISGYLKVSRIWNRIV